MITDEELFRRALESIGKEDIFGGKYGPPLEQIEDEEEVKGIETRGKNDYIEYDETKSSKKSRGKKKVAAKAPNPPENKAIYDVPKLPEECYADDLLEVDRDDFMHLMRYQLDKITLHDHSKYHEPNHSHPVIDLEENPIERTIETEPLPTDPEGLRNVRLMLHQGKLLERYAKTDPDDCAEINLRQLPLKQALSELIDEVEYAYRKEIWFLRVVTGKGLHSKKEGPIIKKGVIEWIEQQGYVMVRGYAPEISPDGDYGVIVLEIRPRTL